MNFNGKIICLALFAVLAALCSMTAAQGLGAKLKVDRLTSKVRDTQQLLHGKYEHAKQKLHHN